MNASAFSAFTGMFNTTGHPAMSVPAGVDGNGLPMGVQFVARLGDEATLLPTGVALARAGRAVADDAGGARRHVHSDNGHTPARERRASRSGRRRTADRPAAREPEQHRTCRLCSSEIDRASVEHGPHERAPAGGTGSGTSAMGLAFHASTQTAATTPTSASRPSKPRLAGDVEPGVVGIGEEPSVVRRRGHRESGADPEERMGPEGVDRVHPGVGHAGPTVTVRTRNPMNTQTPPTTTKPAHTRRANPAPTRATRARRRRQPRRGPATA